MAIKNVKTKEVDLEEEDFVNQNDNAALFEESEEIVMPRWGGEFVEKRNAVKDAIRSQGYDKRMYAVAIESMKVQMRMHAKRHIISDAHAAEIMKILTKIKKDMSEGKMDFNSDSQDIYQVINEKVEAVLGKEIADQMLVARSKSDQVTGDLRIWIRDAYDGLDAALQNLQSALLDKAEENVKTIMPGLSNSQLTQPISFGHYLMSYVEMLARDRSRIKDARVRLNESPYGSGDIGGSEFNLNRDSVARLLGFESSSSNSIDSVASRDFVVEFLSCASMASMHLSRLSEDLISMHANDNSFLSFSNDLVAQHKILPFRRDPEALEAVRGRTGMVYGALMNVLTVLKGLPTQFCQDLTMVSQPVFEVYDLVSNSAEVVSVFIADCLINKRKLKEVATRNYSTATDLMNWLIINLGMPLERAESTTREIVEYSVSKSKKLSLLSIEELQGIEPRITNDVYSVLIPSRAMINRRSGNGTNPVQIRKAIRFARRANL